MLRSKVFILNLNLEIDYAGENNVRFKMLPSKIANLLGYFLSEILPKKMLSIGPNLTESYHLKSNAKSITK